MMGPLEGVRIFDLTVWMVGPWASMMLGSLGADVIHVEQPGIPLSERGAGVPPTLNGTSVGYVTWNMNKRSVYLDLKTEHDRAVAYELIRQCDVFLVNMRPGVAERLGMGYETLRRIRPELVYCALNGWGSSGPMVHEPGADGQMQGFSGFWSVNGPDDGPGEFYRHFTQLDANTGNFAAAAICFGVWASRRRGAGMYIEVPMLAAAAALQTLPLTRHLATGRPVRPLGSASALSAPNQVFRCADGKYLGVAVRHDRDWEALVRVLGEPALLTDPRFRTNPLRVTHRRELAALLAPRFAAYPLLYWLRELGRAGIPCGYPLGFEHLRDHAQVEANGYLVRVETPAWGTVWTGGPPWHFSETPARWFRTPEPGEQTEAILAEFGVAGGVPAGGEGGRSA
jgi:formyl-CoA transferase